MIALLVAVALQAPKIDQAKVDEAIERGAKVLIEELKKGVADVKHPHAEFSHDELIFYTLIHAGVDPKDEQFQALLDRLLTKDLTRTYNVSLLAMGLEAFDRRKYQYRIAQCAQFLVDNQCQNGQWDYGDIVPLEKKDPPAKDVASGGGKAPAPKAGRTESLPVIPVRRRLKGKAAGDNSNSQYAALGLRACLQAGITVPGETLTDAVKWWERNQCQDGSWGYGQNGWADTSGYGSMTAGAVGALYIYRHFLRQDASRDTRIQKGLDWIAKQFTEKENPKYQTPTMWHYYWLYAVERVGILSGKEFFGRSEWYPVGAAWLLANQQSNGMWSGRSMGAPIDTCFAILFLRRATKPLPKVASGK
jgi:hypothetical protein